MYICLCNGITDQDLKNWKEKNPQESQERCLESLKVGKGCGICKYDVDSCSLEEKRELRKS